MGLVHWFLLLQDKLFIQKLKKKSRFLRQIKNLNEKFIIVLDITKSLEK